MTTDLTKLALRTSSTSTSRRSMLSSINSSRRGKKEGTHRKIIGKVRTQTRHSRKAKMKMKKKKIMKMMKKKIRKKIKKKKISNPKTRII